MKNIFSKFKTFLSKEEELPPPMILYKKEIGPIKDGVPYLTVGIRNNMLAFCTSPNCWFLLDPKVLNDLPEFLFSIREQVQMNNPELLTVAKEVGN